MLSGNADLSHLSTAARTECKTRTMPIAFLPNRPLSKIWTGRKRPQGKNDTLKVLTIPR